MWRHVASDVPQVLALTTNSAALALAIAKPLAAAVPVFVIVTERAPLDWPAVTLPNDSAVGDAESDAVPVGTPVPDRPIDIVAPPPVIVYVVLSVTAARWRVREYDRAGRARVERGAAARTGFAELRGRGGIGHVGGGRRAGVRDHDGL